MTINLRNTLLITASCLGPFAASMPALAQGGGNSELLLEEVIITARHREESLQSVPDAVTAFNAYKIEQMGINDIQSYVNQTPNFIVREGFRSGVMFVTIRGVTTSQQGWAPVTYVVDGVKAGAVDVINPGSLFDLEQIEVLRGPQGALYGAGAIAGAVNIRTKAPTDEFEGAVAASYGKGDDLNLKATVSGPIIEDKLAYRVTAFYRDSDGLTDSIEGDDIDFVEQESIKARLLFTPSDTLSIDLRAAYTDIYGGAVKAERFESADQLNDFDNNKGVSRGIVGEENREFVDISAKIDIELSFATLTSATGYLELDQDLYGSISWDNPGNADGSPTTGILNEELYGRNATAGQVIDEYQNIVDNYEIFFQDLRLTSNGDGSYRWLIGAEYMARDTINELGLGMFIGPNPGTDISIPIQFDEKEDRIWGVYGQVNIDLSDAMELTLAGRYDENDYNSRQYDPETGETILQLDEAGNATLDKLEADDSKFQPKVQLSYDWSDDLMTYLSYAEGFRFGFFNTGSATAPETTENYEMGFKAGLYDGRMTFNGALFHIDYSDQQNTVALAEAPFLITENIPDTSMDGIELELLWLVTEALEISAGVGYLDAEVEELKRRPESVPELTTNLGIQYNQPMPADLMLVLRTDWRHQGDFVSIQGGELLTVDSVDLVDIRIGLEDELWAIRGYVKNALDEQYATDPGFFGTFYARDYNPPRSYGVEVSYKF